jgi:predicted nucleic acid-binding protein
MSSTLKPVDPEYLHPDVQAALENLHRLEAALKGAYDGHEAAKSALRQAEALDVDQVAQQQVSGTKLVTPGNASKARAALDAKRLALDGGKRAIELAEEAVLEALAEHVDELRSSLNETIQAEHDKASTAIETILPAIARVEIATATRNWIDHPTRARRSRDDRACPDVPLPPGYSELANVLRVALQPVGEQEPASPLDTFRETRALHAEFAQLCKDGRADWPVGPGAVNARERMESPRGLADIRKLRMQLLALIDQARRTQAQARWRPEAEQAVEA